MKRIWPLRRRSPWRNDRSAYSNATRRRGVSISGKSKTFSGVKKKGHDGRIGVKSSKYEYSNGKQPGITR